MSGKAFYLKGLNGIRAIAALSIMMTHVIKSFPEFGLPVANGLDLAEYGVSVFFTLSGFLITYLLLREKEKHSEINIRQFYIRRVLRIWPLYYFYLIVSFVVLWIYNVSIVDGDALVFYFLLTANVPLIIGTHVPILSHFWSLGVEEQFYLFWPWIIKKASRLYRWMIGFIVFLFVLKLGFWLLYSKTGIVTPLTVIHVTRFHCMAIGALGALLIFKQHKGFIRFAINIPAQLILWTILILTALNKFNIAPLVNDEIISIVTVFWIVNLAFHPKPLIKMTNPYIDYLGKISFGIYVYHPLVIFLTAKWGMGFLQGFNDQSRYIWIYGIVIFVTICVAGLSYRFLERPFLRLKLNYSRL